MRQAERPLSTPVIGVSVDIDSENIGFLPMTGADAAARLVPIINRLKAAGRPVLRGGELCSVEDAGWLLLAAADELALLAADLGHGQLVTLQ